MNKTYTIKTDTIMGVDAPPPRLTLRAAIWLACVLSLPFMLLAVVEFTLL
ncbi:hypothetical protein [Aliishimia ponticola]|nr:hypothetical protein [Aliishimia ponticola]